MIDGLLASPVLNGSLDYLVNAAGVALWGRDGSALDMTEDAWRDVLAVNFDATRMLTVKSVPLLRRGTGRSVVNIASIGGLRNMDAPFDAYQVSKAAVVSFTRSLAEQLGPEGIRCNTVCPGAILTPMIEHLYIESPERRTRMEAADPAAPARHPARHRVRGHVPAVRGRLVHHRHRPDRGRRLDDPDRIETRPALRQVDRGSRPARWMA